MARRERSPPRRRSRPGQCGRLATRCRVSAARSTRRARGRRRSAAPASRCRVEGGSGCGDDYVTGRRCSPRRLRIAHEALLEIVRVLDDVPRAGDPGPHLVGESCLPGLRAQREKVPVARRGPGLGVSRVLHSPYWRRRAPNLTPPTRGSSRRAPAGAPSAWRSRARSSATP